MKYANEIVKNSISKITIPKKEKEAIKSFSKRLYDELEGNVVSILLFGSKSRGDYRKNSDIDILVVLKNPSEDQINYIYGVVMDLVSEYKIYLSVKIFSEKEFEYYKSIPTMFVRNVLKDGIRI